MERRSFGVQESRHRRPEKESTMGILDKAKERATQLAGQAKDKIDDVKEKRRVDDMYRDLGKILYRQRTQDGRPTDDAEIVRLVTELREHEAEEARAASAQTSASQTSASQ